MATYLQGVTDTGFNSVNTTPNLPYMMNALQKVTARYEKNYNELSNEYSKITDSLLLNPENNEFRTKFLDNSKTALKTLSTQDLSIQSNVDQAEQIFSPFWEDQDLMADYTISNQYQKQVQNYNRLKDSDKKEDRDQAWDMGLSYVQLTAAEMSLAKRGDGSIASVKVRPYVPYKNVSEIITTELKNLGYKEGTLTDYKVGNGYITTITNGPGTKKIYANVINNIIDSRPDVQEIFKVQGVTNFETSVFNILKENPSLSKEEAQYKVKENYATKSIKSFEKNIGIYNEELNGNKEYKGLINEVDEMGPGIVEKLKTGILTPDSPEAIAYFNKLDRKEELINVKGLYQKKINNLKSDDYYSTKGEDYMTEIFKNQFIEDNAASREAAVSKTTVSDPSFVASERIRSEEKQFNSEQIAKENKANAANSGSSSTITIDDDGNLVVNAKAEKNNKVKPKELTESELLNIPTVGAGINSKAKDLETSGYYNFQNFQETNKEAIISNGSTYLNKSSLFDNIPNMKEYVNYLTYYATGGKKTAAFKLADIEKAHDALVEKKILPANWKFTENAFAQIEKLKSHVDNNNKGKIDLEGVTARGNYERASVYYLAADEIDKEFIKQYKKVVPNQNIIKFTEKNKNDEYEFITAQTLLTEYKKGLNATNKFYGINTNPDDIPSVSLIQKYINGEITVQGGPAPSYGGYPAPASPYSIFDSKTGKSYNAEAIVKTYGKPENFVAKRKEYEENKNRSFSKFATSKSGIGNDWVMSRELRYRNNSADAIQDKATNIANTAIAENKGNVIEKSGGIIKPVNYDELIKTADSDKMQEVLKLIFKNQNVLDKSLAASSLTFQGRDNESSNVKLEFDSEKLAVQLKSLTDGKDSPSAAALNKAYQSILTNGIEFKIKKDTFRNFAKDTYMSNVVTEKLLTGNGLVATNYEKDNLFYDYKLTSVSNDKIRLAYKIKSYDPELKKSKEFEDMEWEYQEYSKLVGIDNILNDLRTVGIKNASEITQYLKSQTDAVNRAAEIAEVKKQEAVKSNSELYKQLPGETDPDYLIRINALRKK